jgi:transposase
MKTYAGIDLHSSNNYIGVIDAKDNRLYSRRHHNLMPDILKVLGKFKTTLQGVVVESTYNWYWLVDGLMDHGYRVHLANPSAIKTYEGLKHTDDKWDSFWLAHLLRLGILPQGYIYPKEQRPIRDLLRRRQLYVRHRTSHILSLQSMITRNRGLNFDGCQIQRFRDDFIQKMFDCAHLVFTAQKQLATIRFLHRQIKEIEAVVRPQIQLKPEFEKLVTIPGIGDILGLTIMSEVGDIKRFAKVGHYSSYCRCVSSKRLSNGKKKGENNKKNGNRYLGWAYVEAANFCKRNCAGARRFYQRKLAKTNKIVAIKALSNKLAKASYYIIRDQVPFDANKLFG